MSFSEPAPAPATPVMPAAPPPVMAPQGTKPKKKPQQATFLGGMLPDGSGDSSGMSSGSAVGKTLLGS